MEVSESGYYRFLKHEGAAQNRMLKKEILIRKIKEIHAESRGSYGSPRIFKKLAKSGVSCSKTKIERLMRQNEIKAKTKRKYKPLTTTSNHKLPKAENLLARNFTVGLVNKAWAGDITYIKTDCGWLYLAVIIDLGTRRVVGWGMSETIDAGLVKEALIMACSKENVLSGLMFHSDQGSQYASAEFRACLNEMGFVQSMSRKADCYDNAVVESFFHSLKNEFVSFEKFKTKDEARQGIFEWIEVFYNRQRIHSSLNYDSPEVFTQKQIQKIS